MSTRPDNIAYHIENDVQLTYCVMAVIKLSKRIDQRYANVLANEYMPNGAVDLSKIKRLENRDEHCYWHLVYDVVEHQFRITQEPEPILSRDNITNFCELVKFTQTILYYYEAI